MALAETQSLTAGFLASEVRTRLPWERILAEDSGAGGVSLRLREADFLNAPPIVREEAIFAGVDIASSLAAPRSPFYVPVPKRSSVRRAARQGGVSAYDLGPVRLVRQNGFITMTSAVRPRRERGFSLLIKEAGVYTLKGKLLGRGIPDLRIRASGTGASGTGVFPAAYPLVLRNHRAGDRLCKGGHTRRFSDILDGDARSGYTGIITAEDAGGPAAFICLKRGELLVIRRDTGGKISFLSTIEVFGVSNA